MTRKEKMKMNVDLIFPIKQNLVYNDQKMKSAEKYIIRSWMIYVLTFNFIRGNILSGISFTTALLS